MHLAADVRTARPLLPDPSSDGTRATYAAAASRAAVFAVAVLAAYLAYRCSDAASVSARDLLIAPWTHKDAGWFVHIAREGYTHSARTAFFPLYPLLIRAVSVLFGGSYQVAGIVVSLVCYGSAMFLLYRLTAKETTSRTAADTVLLISIFPTAFVFSAIYSESLFLLLTVAVFVFAKDRRWALASLAGFLATLTRSSGLLLFVPLLLFYAGQQGWTWRRPAPAWPRDAKLAWLLLIPAGLVTYMGYLWARFGDGLLFVAVQDANWHRVVEWPWVDVWRGALNVYRGLGLTVANLSSLPSGLLPGHRLEVVLAGYLLPFAALVFAAVCLVIVFRRLPLPYGVYSLLALLLPLLEPSSNVPLYSYHRFVLVVFPLFMGLALALKRKRTMLWVLAALMFVLMLYFTACYGSTASGARGVV